MAHYSIYLPGGRGANDAQLAAAGLPGLCDRGGASWCDVLRGPDGGPGAIANWQPFGRADMDPLIGFHPEQQKWVPGESGRYWFGIEPERPPLPIDMQYKDIFPSTRVTLADKNAWFVPIASQLPREWRWRGGQWVSEVKADFADYVARSSIYMQLVFEALGIRDWYEQLSTGKTKAEELSEDEIQIPVANAVDHCVRALRLNYRLNDAIVDHLGLIDDVALRGIVWASMELHAIHEAREQKKSSEATVLVRVGSSFSAGA